MNSLDEDSQFMKASWQVFGPYCQKSRAFDRLKGCVLSSQDLRGVLDDTAKISKAVELTSKTMTMLNDMMQSEPNQSPKSSSAQERQHVAGQREIGAAASRSTCAKVPAVSRCATTAISA